MISSSVFALGLPDICTFGYVVVKNIFRVYNNYSIPINIIYGGPLRVGLHFCLFLIIMQLCYSVVYACKL